MTLIGDGYQTTDDSAAVANGYASSTDDSTLLSVVAGAALPAGQVVTLKGVYVQD
jgi:ABC-type thiamine transport system ATPase subunit